MSCCYSGKTKIVSGNKTLIGLSFVCVYMGLKVRVLLKDDVQFADKEEQEKLRVAIDEESFTAPEFVGVHRLDNRHITINTRVTDINIENANDMASVVADHFDTEVKSVRILDN